MSHMNGSRWEEPASPTDDDSPAYTEVPQRPGSRCDSADERGSRAWISLNPNDPECDRLVNIADLKPPDPNATRAYWWDLVYPGAVSVLAGPPSIGKTSYTRRVAATVAAGSRASFLGWQGPPTPLNVLVMDFETPRSEHYQAWNDACADHLEARRRITLCEAETAFDANRVARFVKERNIGLVVVDTLSAAFNFAEINSNSETERAMKELRWLARSTGVAVLVLAHCPKAKIDLIGAQAQKAAADVVKFYEPMARDPADGELYRISGAAIGGARGKSRYGKMLEMTFIQSGAGQFDLVTGSVTQQDTKSSIGKVARFLHAAGERGATTTEIVKGTDIGSRTTVLNAIKDLRSESRITVSGQGKATRFFYKSDQAET